jgi:hypothetical protein
VTRTALAAALAALCLASVARATPTDDLLAQVHVRGVWGNTSSYTPTIFASGSAPCTQRVGLRTSWAKLAAKWARVPLPCYFKPSPGTDGEAVVSGSDGVYYEFFQARFNDPAFPTQWSARWGGAEPAAAFTVTPQGDRAWPTSESTYGVQASGMAFTPGVIRWRDLHAGRVAHVVALEAAWACRAFVAPATRSDGADTTSCLPYGTLLRLPPDADCSGVQSPAGRMICVAARDYGLRVTDQTHDRVTFRFENWKRPWSEWGSGSAEVSPYGPYFGCDGIQNTDQSDAHPLAPGEWEQDCAPADYGAFRGFPWSRLIDG